MLKLHSREPLDDQWTIGIYSNRFGCSFAKAFEFWHQFENACTGYTWFDRGTEKLWADVCVLGWGVFWHRSQCFGAVAASTVCGIFLQMIIVPRYDDFGSFYDLFVERTIQGALGANIKHKAIQMWLMQLAQKGGNADLMMTMSHVVSRSHALGVQLGTMHKQSTFTARWALKLEKIQLVVPSEVNFIRWVDGRICWLMCEAYVKDIVLSWFVKAVVLPICGLPIKLLMADRNLRTLKNHRLLVEIKSVKQPFKSQNAKQKVEMLNNINAELAKRYVT